MNLSAGGLKQKVMLRDKMKRAINLEHLVGAVSATLELEPNAVRKPGKGGVPAVVAHGIVCHLNLVIPAESRHISPLWCFMGLSGSKER